MKAAECCLQLKHPDPQWSRVGPGPLDFAHRQDVIVRCPTCGAPVHIRRA